MPPRRASRRESDRNLALASFQTTVGTIASDAGDSEETQSTRAARLHSPAPNPLVRHSVIAFDLPQAQSARVQVFDVAGRLVRSLADGAFAAGRHQRTWDGTDERGNPVAAGVYFTRLDVGAVHEQRSIVVVR
jgi:hypothetical protein